MFSGCIFSELQNKTFTSVLFAIRLFLVYFTLHHKSSAAQCLKIKKLEIYGAVCVCFLTALFGATFRNVFLDLSTCLYLGLLATRLSL